AVLATPARYYLKRHTLFCKIGYALACIDAKELAFCETHAKIPHVTNNIVHSDLDRGGGKVCGLRERDVHSRERRDKNEAILCAGKVFGSGHEIFAFHAAQPRRVASFCSRDCRAYRWRATDSYRVFSSRHVSCVCFFFRRFMGPADRSREATHSTVRTKE